MRKYLLRWWFTSNWEQECWLRLIRRWNGEQRGGDLADPMTHEELARAFAVLFRPCVDPEAECDYQF